MSGYDLHTHSIFSDGTESPTRNVAMAVERDLSGIGITDHDTFDGLDRAVAVSRELSAGNPDNVERRVFVALFLIERGDAARVLAGRADGQPGDRTIAERDYAEAVEILAALEKAGAIAGTDVTSLAEARAKLAAVRAGR